MDGRDAWVDIDESALRHNLRVLRVALGPSVRIYLCVKMNAYGFGSDWVAPIAEQEGTDGFACCDALDAARVRLVDRWLVHGTLPEGASARRMCNYLSIGLDTQAALSWARLKHAAPWAFKLRLINKLW